MVDVVDRRIFWLSLERSELTTSVVRTDLVGGEQQTHIRLQNVSRHALETFPDFVGGDRYA